MSNFLYLRGGGTLLKFWLYMKSLGKNEFKNKTNLSRVLFYGSPLHPFGDLVHPYNLLWRS
jgi:hypothetical protein